MGTPTRHQAPRAQDRRGEQLPETNRARRQEPADNGAAPPVEDNALKVDADATPSLSSPTASAATDQPPIEVISLRRIRYSRLHRPLRQPSPRVSWRCLAKGFGFLREPRRNFSQSNNDVFVTPEVVRKHALRDGMWIKGETRRGSRGPQLFKLVEIEGQDPDNYPEPSRFRGT